MLDILRRMFGYAFLHRFWLGDWMQLIGFGLYFFFFSPKGIASNINFFVVNRVTVWQCFKICVLRVYLKFFSYS